MASTAALKRTPLAVRVGPIADIEPAEARGPLGLTFRQRPSEYSILILACSVGALGCSILGAVNFQNMGGKNMRRSLIVSSLTLLSLSVPAAAEDYKVTGQFG